MHRRVSVSEITSVQRGKHDKDGRQTCLIEAGTEVYRHRHCCFSLLYGLHRFGFGQAATADYGIQST